MRTKGKSVHAKTINGIANDETHKELQSIYNAYRACRKNSKLSPIDLEDAEKEFRALLKANEPGSIQKAKDIFQEVQGTGKRKGNIWNFYYETMERNNGDMVGALRLWYMTMNPKQSKVSEKDYMKPSSPNHKTLKAKHD